jgi:hypothetical protein
MVRSFHPTEIDDLRNQLDDLVEAYQHIPRWLGKDLKDLIDTMFVEISGMQIRDMAIERQLRDLAAQIKHVDNVEIADKLRRIFEDNPIPR